MGWNNEFIVNSVPPPSLYDIKGSVEIMVNFNLSNTVLNSEYLL